MSHFVIALVEQPGQPFAHVRCLVGAYSVFLGNCLSGKVIYVSNNCDNMRYRNVC